MIARRMARHSDRGLLLFMALSMGAHIGVFTFSRVFKSEPRVIAPVYNVRLVTSTPGGGPLAKEASAKGNPEAKAPPVVAPAPAPKPAPVEKAEVKKEAPAPKPVVTKPVPKAAIAKPAKKEPKAEKTKETATAQKAASKNAKAEKTEATQDLGSALSAVKNLIKDKRGHEAGIEGARGTSTLEFGSGQGGAQAGALALQIYVGQVQSAIQRYWNIPAEIARLRIVVQIGLKVGPDGRLVDVWIDEGSGNRVFDESAMRAVRAASPLPVPPQTKNGYFEFYTRFTPEGARSN